MNATAMEASVRRFYLAREEGDLAGCLAVFRNDAVVHYAGSPEASAFARTVEGLDALRVVFKDFIDLWAFERLELASITVGDCRVAVHIVADLRFTLAEGNFRTDIFHLWTFDDAARATRLVEFVDTAMVQMLVGPRTFGSEPAT